MYTSVGVIIALVLLVSWACALAAFFAIWLAMQLWAWGRRLSAAQVARVQDLTRRALERQGLSPQEAARQVGTTIGGAQSGLVALAGRRGLDLGSARVWLLGNLEGLATALDARWQVPLLSRVVGPVGWASLVALVPVVGDVLAAIAGGVLILRALCLGPSPALLLRMFLRILFRMLVGEVPFFGDIVGFLYRANLRNMGELRAFVAAREGARGAPAAPPMPGARARSHPQAPPKNDRSPRA